MLFLRAFNLKPKKILLKNGTRDFQNSPPFVRSACGNFERFQTDFLENENFFQQLECRFLVESTKIESASFPYKTTISETNGKTNRMVSTKWT